MKKIILISVFLITFLNNINAEDRLVNILACEVLSISSQIYREDTLLNFDKTPNYKKGDTIFLKSVFESEGNIANFKFRLRFDPLKVDAIHLPTIDYGYYEGKRNITNKGVSFSGDHSDGWLYNVTFLSDYIYAGTGLIHFSAKKVEKNKWTASYVNLMSDQVVSFISTCEETGDKVEDFISIFDQIYNQ